eukprot:scaffold13100_cov108-Skeletonema_marinoi.AAC.4
MAAAAAAANKSLWTKVSISIASTLIGICLGAQFNILGSLLHINFEGRGDKLLGRGHSRLYCGTERKTNSRHNSGNCSRFYFMTCWTM